MVAQSMTATSDGVIFVSNDAVVFSDNAIISAKIVLLNSKISQSKKTMQSAEKNSGKNSLSKSLSKKKKTNLFAKNKPYRVFSDPSSHQDLENQTVFRKNISINTQNPTFNSELTFLYSALNIPIFVHLEKIYTEEFSLSSEFSGTFFSRPPPLFS